MVAVAILVTVAVVIGHLLPGLDATEIDHEIRNALHVIGFALIAAVIFESLRMPAAYEYLTMRAAIVGGYDSRIIVHISDGEHPGYRVQHLTGDRSVGRDPTTIRFPLRGVVDIPGRPDLDPSKIRDVYIIGKTRRKGKDKSGETRMFLDNIRLE